MEDGLRTLNIASLNPDSMKEVATQQAIINELTKKQDTYCNDTGNPHSKGSKLHDGQL